MKIKPTDVSARAMLRAKKGQQNCSNLKEDDMALPSRSYYSTFKGIQGVQAMVDERMEEVIRTEEPQVRDPLRSLRCLQYCKDNFCSVPDLSARI